VSEKIRKVTYNTDSFNKHNFEMRKGNAFHFNSGRIGKFIECEFENPMKICRSKLVSDAEANCTFVIQASSKRERWHTMVAFRQI